MRGILFACLGGVFIALQGAANSRISEGIGTWQTAALTQLTGFAAALVITLAVRDRSWRSLKQVKPLYLSSGAFGAVIIFGNVAAMHRVGAAVTISAVMIAQLLLTFVIDSRGWFDLAKLKVKPPQFIGIGIMAAGVVILGLN
ncbi:DMT family transporter [Paenibacillus sacheonensis]|uniref:EamA-like transporter family protein n=1 Tax=Paenibacillus sacheonensis TaxID=742054 RepID=A0A7X4YJF9_9BACL|nr:transporter family-2 protein [Paenibacillus sacheonensis]NBC67523.1 EamA-like transporter family protein [Paenibacillus sacheonensis]